jgi:hypothetical protein
VGGPFHRARAAGILVAGGSQGHRPLGMALGLDWLMYLGGIVIGARAEGITLRATIGPLHREHKLSTVLRAVGGAVSGFLSSIMFFPIVAIL